MSGLSIGFTGTQQGMTPAQYNAVFKILSDLKNDITKVRHGDCIGADAEFHAMAQKLNLVIVIHPPINSSKRAFCKGYNEEFPKKEYLVRNRDIVDNSDILIATPHLPKEELRSGTWATVRYARRINTRTFAVLPNGKVETK